MLRRGFLSLFFSVLFIMAVPCLGFAENGVTNDEITVGTATNLTGATVGVAEEFNAGISAYFAKVNKSGGVFGRQIKRLMYNDGYEPEVTLKETLKLVDTDKVFALIGYASTPAAKIILRLLNEKKIPLIAPYSGSEYLRDPAQKYVFNIKAGYPDQVETLVKLAVNSLGLKEVCAFYQDDALGRTGIDAAEKALKAQGLKLHAKASYKRNSMEIEPALNVLKGAGCKALLMASQDRQSAVFVAKANAAGFHPQFFCLNLIGTGEFLNRVKDLNEKIYVSIVTPLPTETAYPIVKEFRKEVTTLNPSAKITANTLEGYLVGAVFEDVLRRSGKALTRIAFSAAFENLKDANIGGITFTFDKSNRQATNKVFLTRVENGELAFLP